MIDPSQLRLRRWVLLVWIFVVFYYFYLSYDYIRVSLNDNQLSSYLDYVVQMAGNENRPPKEIRALILVKSEELGLPIRGDQIQISGERASLKVSLSYGIDIIIPVLQRVLYHKVFDHDARYHQVR